MCSPGIVLPKSRVRSILLPIGGGMKEKLGGVLAGVGGVVLFAGTLVVSVFLLHGIVRFFELFGDKLATICGWLFLLTLVLLLLSPIRVLRSPMAIIIYTITYVWGAFVWLFSAYVCYALWGIAALVIGIVMGGVGVLPVALAAYVFHGYFADAGWLLLALVFVLAFRSVSIWLMIKSDNPEEKYMSAASGDDY